MFFPLHLPYIKMAKLKGPGLIFFIFLGLDVKPPHLTSTKKVKIHGLGPIIFNYFGDRCKTLSLTMHLNGKTSRSGTDLFYIFLG